MKKWLNIMWLKKIMCEIRNKKEVQFKVDANLQIRMNLSTLLLTQEEQTNIFIKYILFITIKKSMHVRIL
jgi:hypothetical protein